MANFCPHCGAQLARPEAAFCATCGRSLRASPITGGVGGPHLRLQLPGHAEETFAITQPRLTIGRDPGNDLVLDSPIVSRRHAELTVRDDAVWLRDLGSANGTAVNGQLVSEWALNDGDIIRIGDEQGNSVGLVFRRPSAGPSTGTIQLGRKELGQAAVFVIGRDPSATLQLDHPTVSRLHAEVRPSPDGPVLRDLGSSNGTFLNGELLTGPRPLAARDVVQIGPYKLVYDQAGFAQYTPGGNYRIDAVRLVRRVNVGGGLLRRGAAAERVILRDVSLSVYPREFVALVGGSGAGKSTLLNAMSGFAPSDGRVLVNGEDLYDNFAAYRSILGYVPQDDIIHNLLPVRSALTYAARLRLPDATGPEIEARVNKVLGEVEMGDHAVTHCVPRMKKVIAGEQGGISKSVGWSGGGGLRFYRLGDPVFDETGHVSPNIRFANLAAHLWFAETGHPLVGQATEAFLGGHDGIGYYLLFNGILGDKRPDGGNILTSRILTELPVFDGPKVVFGEGCRMGAERLKQEGIIFRHIPYEIKAR